MSCPPPQPSPSHLAAQVFMCVAICPDLSFLQSEIPPKEAIGSLPNPWYLSPSPQGQAQFHGLFLFLTSPKKASPGLQNRPRPKGKVLEEIPGVMWRCFQHLQEPLPPGEMPGLGEITWGHTQRPVGLNCQGPQILFGRQPSPA